MEPTTYRDPARDRPIARIDALLDAGGAQEVAVLSSLAAMAGTGAFVAHHSELIALAKHFVRLRSARKKQDVLAQFFGCREVIEEPGAWTSPDRRSRLRAAYGDPLPRWETLDPGTGETLATVRGPAPLVPPSITDALVLERRRACVHGRAREPRCFAGIPRTLGGRPIALGDASAVILEVRRDGVLLERRDAAGALVGDTWHPDRNAALRQLAIEYGDLLGAWQDSEIAIVVEPRIGWDGFARSRLTL